MSVRIDKFEEDDFDAMLLLMLLGQMKILLK